MKTMQWTHSFTISALALALTLGAASLNAQPAQRDQRGGQRDNPGATAPVQRGPANATPVQRGPNEERGARGPADAEPVRRGPMDGQMPGNMGPGQGGGPAAGLMAEFTPFWDRPQVTERMSLSEDQVTALKASYDKQRPTIESNNTRMREAGQKIAEALNAEGEPDLTAVRKAVNDFTSAQNAAMMAAVEHRATVQKTLNTEQLASLRQMRQRIRVPGMMDGRMMDGRDMEDRMRDPRAVRPDRPDAPGDLPDLPDRRTRDGARRDAAPEAGAVQEERVRGNSGDNRRQSSE